VDDAARAYLLAAEKAEAGSVFNCTAETDITTKSLAEAIGEAVAVPVRGKSRSEVEQLWGAFLTGFVDYENRASSARLRTQLGWQPEATRGLLEDIRQGSYRELAERLRNGRGDAARG
jgi:nucleoside-diphosphate-sugar epimerase